MKRARFSLPVVVWSVFVLCPFGLLGQAPDESEQPAQRDIPAQSQHRRHVPIFGNADEFALATDLEYYAPQPGFDRQNRDIDLQMAHLAVAAHMRQGWE